MIQPCKDPANDPEDWFISKDGKQYSDDVLVDDSELENVAWEARALYVEGLDHLRAKAALVRRRHAKDACYQCPLRAECLTKAIDDPKGAIEHGTWGGYYEEERRAIITARIARQARRRAAAVAAGAAG